MPSDLDSLTSKKAADRAKAAANLGSALVSDKAAAAEAAPRLVEIALAKETPDRHRILALLAELVTGGHAALLESGDFSELATPAGGGAKGRGPAALVSAQEGKWQGLLGDADAKVRAAAAMLLAFSSTKPAKAADAVAKSLDKEKDAAVRTSELLSLGVLEARAGEAEHLLQRVLPKPGEPARKLPAAPEATAEILALGYAQPSAVRVSMLQWLEKNSKLEVPSEKLPFYEGKIGALARKRRAAFDKVDVKGAIRDLEALIAGHPAKVDKLTREKQAHPFVSQYYGGLLERALAKFDGRAEDDVLPEELDDDQRALLVFGPDHYLNPVRPQFGVGRLDSPDGPNGMYWSVKRYLGALPPGPLDARVTISGRSLPWWKVFLLLQRKKLANAVVEKALHALDTKELLGLATDVTYGAYAWDWGEGANVPSPRAALLLAELDGRGEGSKGADLRTVLDAMSKKALFGLIQQGWKGGPFVAPKKAAK